MATNACTAGAVRAATVKRSKVPNLPSSVQGQVRSAILKVIRGDRGLQKSLGLSVGGSQKFDIIISVSGRNLSLLLQQGNKRICLAGSIVNKLKGLIKDEGLSGLYREMKVSLTAAPNHSQRSAYALLGSYRPSGPPAVPGEGGNQPAVKTTANSRHRFPKNVQGYFMKFCKSLRHPAIQKGNTYSVAVKIDHNSTLTAVPGVKTGWKGSANVSPQMNKNLPAYIRRQINKLIKNGRLNRLFKRYGVKHGNYIVNLKFTA
ncbi:MAG: hypothetical protein U9R38_04925 [Candidatus Margulisiibacteriota bacterium]|nr:hypothetical protein [Candidatus Margulisiibacteriota bacterium]